MQLLYCFCF